MLIKPGSTLHELAEQIRSEAFTNIGEKAFAKLMLYFDKQTGNDAERAIGLWVANANPTVMYLAICWLDGKGLGDISFGNMLTRVIEERREWHFTHACLPRQHGLCDD
ncbi:MAG TPA: hypothetical protein VH186_03405 [Chloroflexia bacterium]|nr:hypothetical protein [Chloroflexia bacterium]